MKRMYLLVPLLGALALPAALWAAPGDATNTAPAKPASKLDTLFDDPVIVKGKGVEVKRSQFDDEVVRAKAQLAAGGRMISAEQIPLLEQQVLNGLIQIQLLQTKATEADKTAGKELAQKKIDEAKAHLGSDEKVDTQLKIMGLTRAEFMAKLTQQGTAESVIKRELNVNISEDDVKKFYDDNPSKFEQPEQVHVSHILLATKDMTTKTELTEDKKAAKLKLAQDLVKRARAGEDFAKLAKEYSEDPGSKDKGGEYTFPRGQMVAEFEATAFSLNPGQVSDVVTTQFGYHVIKLLEKIPAKKMELAKVAPDLKEYLSQQAIGKQLPDYLTKLKKDADVQILDEKLKAEEAATAAALPPGHPAIPTGANPKTP
jgi:peptidyl-prolyl cis-trans isomerase C